MRSEGLAPRRVVVTLIGMFGLLALVITAAGIAGVIAFSVNQRTQEFGIRMALGAQRSRVLGLVLREGLVLVTVGLAIGLAGAYVLTKLLGAVIFEQQSTAGLTLLIGTHRNRRRDLHRRRRHAGARRDRRLPDAGPARGHGRSDRRAEGAIVALPVAGYRSRRSPSELATGNWQQATGNWQLATGNWFAL